MSKSQMRVKCLYDKLVKLSELVPHPKNRNVHPKNQIKRLAEILEYQGWRYPVKVSKLSGFVTSGHGRVEAAKVNGWEKIPVNYQEYDSEAQEYADVQADNAIALWAEIDEKMVALDLKDLPDLNIDMLGFEDLKIPNEEKYKIEGKEVENKINSEKSCPACGYEW